MKFIEIRYSQIKIILSPLWKPLYTKIDFLLWVKTGIDIIKI